MLAYNSMPVHPGRGHLVVFGALVTGVLVGNFFCSCGCTGPKAGEKRTVIYANSRSCLSTGSNKARTTPQPRDITRCVREPSDTPELTALRSILVGLPRGGRCRGGKGGCETALIGPYDPQLRTYGNDWPPFGYTMVGVTRMQNLHAIIEEVVHHRIPGGIAELGVWRGGAMIYAAAILQHLKERRNVYLFDIFGSLKNSEPRFGYGSGGSSFLAVPLTEVRSSFEDFGLMESNVHFIKGKFQDTLPKFQLPSSEPDLAVLRIDGNFYRSYEDALYYLYAKVPIGGFVIFDDIMSHKEVRKAWNDFQQDHGFSEELVQIDSHCAWFRKTKLVAVDFNHYRTHGM